MAEKDQKDHFSRKEAAYFLTKLGYKISEGTLRNMASNGNAGKGPPFIKYRWRTVVYAKADLIEWAAREGEKVT